MASMAPKTRNIKTFSPFFRGRAVLGSALVFAASTAGSALARHLDRPISSALIFVLGVTMIGAIAGLRGGLVAALAASFIYNFFLSEPVLQFSATSADELLPLFAFNFCAILSGLLAGRLNDRARIAERAQARLNILFVVSDRLQTVVLLPDIVAVMNDESIRPWLGRFELYDAERRNVGAPDGMGRWSALVTETFDSPVVHAQREGAVIYRLGQHGRTLGFAVFGQAEDRSNSPLVDMDALIALLAMTVERCLLLERLSQTEAVRRSEELKTALLSSLSHDMRTPLSAISASASSLLSLAEDLDPAVRLKLLQTIKEQCERLDRYTANLLDLGRLQAGIGAENLGDVDVVETLGVVLHSMRAPNATHQIAKQIDCRAAVIRANPAMVEQIFRNLVDNAIRYSPDGSLIALRLFAQDAHVQVEIIDQGCGVPTDEIPRLFDRFYRSSRTAHQQGHGLGLSIAKGFVEAFGGTIGINSPHAGGIGTQVIVRLPLRVHSAELVHG